MSYFEWTGNPFVDTGLAVAVIRANKSSLDEMTLSDFKNVLGDGKWLAHANEVLSIYNAYFLNPLLNRTLFGKARKKYSKGKINQNQLQELLESYRKEYLNILLTLVNNIQITDNPVQVCECCGKYKNVNSQLRKLDKDVSRSAFPLLGSIGNDAQALPAASRSAKLCGFCLVCVQLAPLGSISLNGKAVCFQYTSPDLLINHVKAVLGDNYPKVELAKSGDKISVVGTGERSTGTTNILLNELSLLRQKLRVNKLPSTVQLNIWTVSNSGNQEKDGVDIYEIPNNVLQFLFEISDSKEIKNLLRQEGKSWKAQLFECIARKLDYELLYPKKSAPASKELFALYQTDVMGRSLYSLNVAEWIAFQLRTRLQGEKEKKLLNDFTKYLGDYKDAKKCKPKLKQIMAQIADEGNLSYEEYSALFPIVSNKPIRVDSYSWKYIWFYLNHGKLNEQRPQSIEETTMSFDNQFRKTIKQFAADVYDWYTAKHGKEKFQKRILEGFKNDKITTGNLQRWFCNLAEITGKEHYTNDAWDELCRDENGANRTYEIRFQLWLEFANLYRNNNN